jgi:hypothetical protein
MTNKIVFTQDVPGEREWINSHFPGYINLETVHSGKWPPNGIFADDNNLLFEYSRKDPIVDTEFVGATKSLYTKDIGIIDNTWIYADNLISNLDFSIPKTCNEYYQAVTFRRVGTVFTESLLRQQYKRLAAHYANNKDNKLVNLLTNHKNTDIALIYRDNWWEWITSCFIGHNYGFHHHDTQIDWASLPAIELSESVLDQHYQLCKTNWNFFCNLRVLFPDRIFYLLEFSDMIEKYSAYTDHKKIIYDKKQLISNFDLMHNIFNLRYKNNFETITKRCCSHLVKMKCITNLDNIIHI